MTRADCGDDVGTAITFGVGEKVAKDLTNPGWVGPNECFALGPASCISGNLENRRYIAAEWSLRKRGRQPARLPGYAKTQETSVMRHQLHSDIDIEAPPAVVWSVLTDLDGYAEWNPFVVSSQGSVAVGEKLTNRMQPPGGKAMTFRPKVTEVEPERVFEWLGRLGFPGVFDGRHRFEIEPTSTGSRLTQSEKFNGVLVRFMKKSLDTKTLQGFEAMNTALKTKAEAQARTEA